MLQFVVSRRDVLTQLLGAIGLLTGSASLGSDAVSDSTDIALRDRALRAMRATDSNPSWFTSANWDNRAYGPWTDYLAGRMTETEFTQACANPSDYCLRDVWNLKKPRPDRIDWQNKVPFNWNGIHALALRFFRTGDPIYLGKWMDVVSDYADWSLASSKTGTSPLSTGLPAPLLDSALAWGGIFTALCIMAKGLGPRDPAGSRGEDSPFAKNPNEVNSRDLDLVSATTLLKIASALASGPGIALARYYTDPKYVPNQRVFGFEVLSNLGAFFPALPPVSELRPTVRAGMLDVFSRYRQRDGGQLEQSFNYAQDLAFAAARATKLPFEPKPTWFSEAEQTVTGWARMSAALATPGGGLPQVGNAIWGRFGRPEQPLAFACTSIALPFSGYYAMRSGWAADAAYLFFFYRRAARGHSMAGCNSIQVAAFGRQLLIAGGSANYTGSSKSGPAVVAYLSEESTYKTNTILVDGRSQNGGSLQGLPRDATGKLDITHAPVLPIDSRWHSGTEFDFAEGLFSEGYKGTLEDPTAQLVSGVSHLRQVVFVRSMMLWLVIDALRTTGSHVYTQVWKFAAQKNGLDLGGFSKEQIKLVPPERRIETTDDTLNAVNLSMWHFGVERLNYRRYFGEGAFGWYGPGPLAEAVPANDVHVQWEGTGRQLLITVIAPHRGRIPPFQSIADTSGSGTASCRIQSPDGTSLSVTASAGPALLKADGIELAQGGLLIALDRPRSAAAALAISDAASYELLGSTRKRIAAPEGFKWGFDKSGRLLPNYDAA